MISSKKLHNIMTNLRYICQKCGTCCHEVPGDYVKRIPLYPDEADILIEVAKERDVPFLLIEDLVFPDIKNDKILVVTYRIKLDNETQGCPFYDPNNGCTVHDVKPLACQAYPLALKQIDSFNFKIDIDPLCNFVIDNYDDLEKVNLEEIKEIFKDEWPKAMNHLKKNKNIMLKIKKWEYSKKVEISRQITLEEFNKCLQEWDRVEVKAGKE